MTIHRQERRTREGDFIVKLVDDVALTITTTTNGGAPVVTALSQAEADRLIATDAADAKVSGIAQAVATLRAWAEDGESLSTSGMTLAQNNAVTELIGQRMGTFLNRFADLLEADPRFK